MPESKINTSFPIVSGEKLLGLINIQAISPDPWSVEIETMQIVANQIALSLDNIRLLEQHQRRLQEISHLAGETTQTAWNRWLSGESLGFQYDQLHILPVSETFPEEVHTNLTGQKSAFYVTEGNNPHARLVAPIVLRDNVIGVVGYEDADPQHDWSQTEITLLETIASRVSLALENSRLVAEAEQRAERERIIGQITSRMRETLDFDTILQTAIKEMQRSFELHEAEIRLRASSPE
jgi:GAF domain-containing protein